MKRVKRFLIIFSATWLLAASQVSHGRHAALLIDADTGNVLYELEANQAWYPASLTKLMTLYMTFSALETGRLRLNQGMTVSNHAARQPTSKLGLRPWETISVEDAILAIITRSANDASVVLAEEIAGSESQFAIKMTSTAHSLGMHGSHFMNATGLPHDWQTTTAHDMALLAYRLKRDFPQYYPYFAADGMYFRGREYRGINKFTANYPGAEGMKTGYTCGSGYNLVGSAHQYGKHLIGVVLGGKSSGERYDHMFNMMDMGFSDPNNAYRSKSILTMNKNSVGVPPYQLSCGHRPTSHYASSIIHHNEDEDDTKVRYVKKSSHVAHVAHLASYNKPPEHTPVTRVKIAGKTKTIVREAAESRPSSKASAKNAKNIRSREKVSTSKTSVASAKSKSTAKAEKIARTASNKSKSKGYYSPSDKKSVTTAKSNPKNSKGNHKPETPIKTASKNTSKTKRNTKTKS